MEHVPADTIKSSLKSIMSAFDVLRLPVASPQQIRENHHYLGLHPSKHISQGASELLQSAHSEAGSETLQAMVPGRLYPSFSIPIKRTLQLVRPS
jgi:hypothetical protein